MVLGVIVTEPVPSAPTVPSIRFTRPLSPYVRVHATSDVK